MREHVELNGSEERRHSVSNRMSDAEYERERTRLIELYGKGRSSEKAKGDQALAKLFLRSGWNEKELAAKEGKKGTSGLSYIYDRMRFARFLDFSASGGISQIPLPLNLTERCFRGYWQRTDKSDGNDRVRFQEVLRLINEEMEAKLVKSKRPSIREALLKEFSDGRWHSHETIAKKFDTTVDHVVDTLADLRKSKKGATYKCERKQVGKSFSERIFPPDPKERQVSSTELTTKLGPIIEGLTAEGKKDLATFSPNTVRGYAHKLKQLLDEWGK